MAAERGTQSVKINLKAVLLLVVVACAAMVGFSKLGGRTAAVRISVVTRRPLHPLTPPITADKVAIIADLRVRNFDKIEATLMSFQAAAEKNVTQEVNAHQAFEAFTRDDPALDAALQAWLKRSPRSYVAHLARAEFLCSKGFNARGSKWASETSAEQFQRMKDYFAAGQKEAQAALALNPKLADAYALLVAQQRASGEQADCMRATDSGLKHVPASFIIRDETMICLKPRWGGSYEAMNLFAAQSQAYVHENPRLAVFKGFADNDRGELLSNDGKYDAAIAYFTRAIAEGGDYSTFYRERGDALMRLDRYAESLEDLSRANQLLPQSPETLESIAYGLSATGKNQEALAELDLAVDISGPWPYEQQLRNDIVAQLSRNLRDAGASGN